MPRTYIFKLIFKFNSECNKYKYILRIIYIHTLRDFKYFLFVYLKVTENIFIILKNIYIYYI